MRAEPPRLVTPEAVVLAFETAGLGSRILAAMIDLAIQGLLLMAATLALFGFAGVGDGSATAGVVVLVMATTLALLGYPIAFETLWRGRTPGKAVLGLRVVATDGAPIRFRHAAVRGMLTLVDFYLTSGAAAVLTVLFTAENQRLGDLAAGTLVLRQRTGAPAPAPIAFHAPPGYETYAGTLDLSRLTADDYGALRSFLLRAASLPPETRGPLAERLATTIAERIGHTPPPGVAPAAFLVCVAAVHQSAAGRPGVAGRAPARPLPPVDEGAPPPMASGNGGFAPPA
jgi:uncharacterized RDD family membrane protein YckC